MNEFVGVLDSDGGIVKDAEPDSLLVNGKPERNGKRRQLTKVGRTALLTAADEVALAKRIEAGVYARQILESGADYETATPAELEWLASDGKAAKDHMLEANQGLVKSLAKRYVGRGLDFDDLVQEGTFGLIRAVEKFDYKKGYKFSTYSRSEIMQAMAIGIFRGGPAIRIEDHAAERLSRLKRRTNEFIQEHGYEPTDEQVAELVKTTVEDVERLKSLPRTVASLDEPVNADDNEGTLGMFIAGTSREVVEEEVIGDDTFWMADSLLSVLSDVEREVVRMRYGFYGEELVHFTQIQRKLGMSEQAVRKAYREAMEKMDKRAKRLSREGI